MKAFHKGLIIAALLSASGAVRAQDPPTLAEKLGYEKDAILLIVHADDLGLAQSVNAASIQAFEQGGITSGSVMVPCPWTPDFAGYFREHPNLDVGIHITLNAEWEFYRWGGILPSTQIPSLLDEAGYLYATVEEVAQHARVEEVEQEVKAQIERALALGIRPTHLDTHMGSIGARPEFFQVYLNLGKTYRVPVLLPRYWLQYLPEELQSQLSREQTLVEGIYMMEQDPGALSWPEVYRSMIDKMQPGLNLMIVHLAHDNDEMRAITLHHSDFGASWRQNDFNFVTSSAFQEMLEEKGIRLVTWKKIREAMYPQPPR
jgi:predicted glycoside hydrolase/deacetylase ChbG (UPF0249 family)